MEDSIKINNYVLHEEIGRGAQGVIYNGYREDDVGRKLAIKIIEDSGNLDRLLIEPELLSKLNHQNIIRIEDYFIHAGKLILITDYFESKNLQQYFEANGRFTPAQVREFLIQIATALAYAHSKFIIHCDLKLSNILRIDTTDGPQYILADFGISRMTEGIQRVKNVSGTYFYMAPEQLRGRPCEQSDLWALGVCAYTLLTGEKPFQGDSLETLSHQISYKQPEFIISATDTTDFLLENAILKLLEKQVVNRFASASDLLRELGVTDHVAQKNVVSEAQDDLRPATRWENAVRKKIRSNNTKFWIYGTISLIPDGIIAPALAYGGAYIFFKGQERGEPYPVRTLLGLAMMVVALFVGILVAALIGYEIGIFLNLITLCFIAAAYNNHLAARNLEFEILLMRALRGEINDRGKLTELLSKYLRINWEDVNIHLKYIECLLAENRLKEAVVECKMILSYDVYNFDAGLLLANCYYELGLYDECERVCNSFLALSSHSFEFSDLKHQCKRSAVL